MENVNLSFKRNGSTFGLLMVLLAAYLDSPNPQFMLLSISKPKL